VLDASPVPVATGTAVTLTGMAKDSAIGLFTQRSGEKVVKKVLATLGWQESS